MLLPRAKFVRDLTVSSSISSEAINAPLEGIQDKLAHAIWSPEVHAYSDMKACHVIYIYISVAVLEIEY